VVRSFGIKTAARQGLPAEEGGGGELRLVLVETCTEEYEGRVYSWEEIYGEGWYSWDKSTSETSTFGLCVNSQFQGTGAGRELIEQVLEAAESTGWGPPIMTLTVQDINQRAWQLCERRSIHPD
jgi:GNAT superfamily N-acetyltransferase